MEKMGNELVNVNSSEKFFVKGGKKGDSSWKKRYN